MKTMLIAAGSEIINEELARVFQSTYQVYTCSRGDDALQILREIRPDVLIINLSLPHITGLEILQQTDYTPPAILAMTSYLSDHITQEAQAAGVKALIRLPCTMKHIVTSIGKIILIPN